ncbi:MAG: plasmid pRiA4b ORF-3 family protein [Myxococcales bacterium]|nr:MAG: plasmid pRiA4b ORF-3 family protein [Myxococcales bacterium]
MAKPAKIYQIKLTLKSSKPPIWRRLLVPSTIRLSDFHMVIQTAMGWTNSHMSEFYTVVKGWHKPGPDEDKPHDAREASLDQLLKTPKDKCYYTYDFGDNWEHEILLEKVADADASWPGRPVCLKGVRACPPEDCGGVWGYYELLETVSDPKHPEHKEMKEWLGPFDPEAFDLETVNRRLGGMKVE